MMKIGDRVKTNDGKEGWIRELHPRDDPPTSQVDRWNVSIMDEDKGYRCLKHYLTWQLTPDVRASSAHVERAKDWRRCPRGMDVHRAVCPLEVCEECDLSPDEPFAWFERLEKLEWSLRPPVASCWKRESVIGGITIQPGLYRLHAPAYFERIEG
ncbi:MAG: hypothetical protein PHU49_15080 [Syntrophorhabdaceae bacterium]|nr:hypothetical protein [Syntrophorhabdaceae bacterium]